MRFVVLCTLLLLSVDTALALRCGRDLVLEGDHLVEVLQSCGEPVYRDRRLERRPVVVFRDHYGYYHEYREVVVEEWVYNLGPRRFMRRLEFHDGELKEIETLDYGY